jgi:hypothetical protein
LIHNERPTIYNTWLYLYALCYYPYPVLPDLHLRRVYSVGTMEAGFQPWLSCLRSPPFSTQLFRSTVNILDSITLPKAVPLSTTNCRANFRPQILQTTAWCLVACRRVTNHVLCLPRITGGCDRNKQTRRARRSRSRRVVAHPFGRASLHFSFRIFSSPL